MRGNIEGYESNRMVVVFSMMDGRKEIPWPSAPRQWMICAAQRAISRARVSCHFISVGGCCRAAGTNEGGMSKATRDDRHRSTEGEISGKHGNTLIRTLRKIYGQRFAAGNPAAETHHEVLLKLNETSLS